MSLADSSVVSSSASRVLARSLEGPFFFSSRSRRYFSVSFFVILVTRAVLVGIPLISFVRKISRSPGFEREIITELFRPARPFLGIQQTPNLVQAYLPFFRSRSQSDLRDTPSRLAANVRLPP